jgi:hypothetical protein
VAIFAGAFVLAMLMAGSVLRGAQA